MHKVIHNASGITSTTISRLAKQRGMDYIRSRFGDSVIVLEGVDAYKKYPERKTRDKYSKYRGSLFLEYYVRYGTMEKMASIIGVTRERIRQMLEDKWTRRGEKKSYDKYLNMFEYDCMRENL